MSSKRQSDWARWLIFPVICLGGGILLHAFWQVVGAWQQELFIPWLFLLAATVIVGSLSVRLPGTRCVVSVSDAFHFSALLLFGLPQAVINAALDAFVATRRQTPRISSVLFSSATMAVSITAGGKTFLYALERLSGRSLADAGISDLIWPLALLALVHYLADSLLVASAMGLRYRQSVLGMWKREFLWTSVACFSSASTAGIAYLLIRHFGFPAFGIVSPVLAITYFSYRIYSRSIEERDQHMREIARVHLSTIECLATAIDAKDQVTHGHIRRVQVLTIEMARRLEVSELEMEGLRAAALLHDIGKLAVPEYILNKPAKLTAKEFERIKIHTLVGAEILSAVDFPYPVIPGVLHHHERWDGTGYPSGLKGADIPLAARILALADFYDALTSDRPYRKAMDKDRVLGIIREESGRMFDPRLAALFCDHIDHFEEQVKRIENGQQSQLRYLDRADISDEVAETVRPRPEVLEKIASATREVHLFYDLARHLGRSLEIPDLLCLVGNKLERLVPHTDLVIYLLDVGTDTLVASHVTGPHQSLFENHTIARGQGVSGWALANRRSLINTNPALDFLRDKLDLVGGLRNLSVFPLVRDQESLGCISLYATAGCAGFDEDHARIMETVSPQIAEALSNAMLYEQTRVDSLTDPLTGLHNSRFLYPYVEQELRRAAREGQPLSVLVLDIDAFKRINDVHGHPTGDQVLVLIAERIRRAIRETDLPVRYAGDEFILVLQATGLLEAQLLMSRIQESVQGWRLPLPEDTAVRVGLSAGCSCFPDDGRTMEELFMRADRRMYENKALRRAAGSPDGAPARIACLATPRALPI